MTFSTRSHRNRRWPLAVLLIAALAAACAEGVPTGEPTPSNLVPPSAAVATTGPARPTQSLPPTGEPAPSNLVPPSAAVATTGPARPTQSLPPIEVPDPPEQAAAPTGTSDEQAATLAGAVADGGQPALSPLLAVYRQAGLSVIGLNGEPLPGFGDDPVGIGWWMVRFSAGGNPRLTVPLSDVPLLLLASDDPPDIEPAELAGLLADDLREMADGPDGYDRFLARFVAARATAHGPDPLDKATDPDDVRLDMMTFTLLSSAMIRRVVQASVAADPGSFIAGLPIDWGATLAAVGPALPPVRLVATAPASNPCNPTGDAEQVSFWTQWIASKVAGGFQLPGMREAFRSLTERLVKNASQASKLNKTAARAGAAAAALLFALQMSSLTVELDQNPNPLVRTKTTRDGQSGRVITTISYDLEGSSLDGGTGIKNCLAMLANALGIQAALPTNGPIPGATVKFDLKTGFNDFVKTVRAGSQLTQDTDADGRAYLDIEGMAQRQNLPNDAIEWPREATLGISATVEPTDARSIANTFWDSLGFAATALSGGSPGDIITAIVAPALDIAKTIRYDWGERTFLVIDWQVGWKIDQPTGFGHMDGLKCDGIGGVWSVTGTYNTFGFEGHQTWNVTIDAATKRGTYNYTDNQAGNGVSIIFNVTGTATLDIDSLGRAHMHLVESTRKVIVRPRGGIAPGVPLQSYDLVWELAEGSC
jgi:hypothetical protein